MTEIMSDERDASISPEYRERESPELHPAYHAGVSFARNYIQRAIDPIQRGHETGIHIDTGETGGIVINEPESTAPYPALNARCSNNGGRGHRVATPEGNSEWSLLTYKFADGSGIKLRLCELCSGVFWERTEL